MTVKGHSQHLTEYQRTFPASDRVPEENWLVDSGASSHMTPNRRHFLEYRSFSTPEKIGLGDGRVLEAVRVGSIRMNMLFKVSNSKKAVMYDVLHVPKLASNLFSVRAAAKRGNTVKFGRSKCWIRGRNGTLDGMGSLVGKLYHLECELTEKMRRLCQKAYRMLTCGISD